MNPLLRWIEAHARAMWSNPRVRESYERLNNEIPVVNGRSADTQWRSALSQAYHRDRVRSTIENAHHWANTETVLHRVMAFNQTVMVRVLIEGEDWTGQRFSKTVDVEANRGERMGVFHARVAEQLGAFVEKYDLENGQWSVLPGSQAV